MPNTDEDYPYLMDQIQELKLENEMLKRRLAEMQAAIVEFQKDVIILWKNKEKAFG